MSLDIYLYKKKYVSYDKVEFIEEDEEVFHTQITHNLGKMASAAGIYEALWRPYQLKDDYPILSTSKEEYQFEEDNPVYAKDIISTLEIGLEDLKEKPEYFKTFNPVNGWGIYDILVEVVGEYLEACKKHPDTIVKTDR